MMTRSDVYAQGRRYSISKGLESRVRNLQRKVEWSQQSKTTPAQPQQKSCRKRIKMAMCSANDLDPRPLNGEWMEYCQLWLACCRMEQQPSDAAREVTSTMNFFTAIGEDVLFPGQQ